MPILFETPLIGQGQETFHRELNKNGEFCLKFTLDKTELVLKPYFFTI